jgi:hypothetical protein
LLVEPTRTLFWRPLDVLLFRRGTNIFFPTSSLKMTFPSLNLEMKVGVCITCEESKSLPSLVGKVKKKIDPQLGTFFKITFIHTYTFVRILY